MTKRGGFSLGLCYKPYMPVWTQPDESQIAQLSPKVSSPSVNTSSKKPVSPQKPAKSTRRTEPPPRLRDDYGWPIPSVLGSNPEEARARIQLPEFDELLLEKARVISSRFPFAEAEYRNLRAKEPNGEAEIPHFEKVFRIAASIASTCFG